MAKKGGQKRLVAQLMKAAARRAFARKFDGLSPNAIAENIRKASDGFLLSIEWRELRQQAIAIYGTTCCKCGQEQTRKCRVNIDHVKPRRDYPELALDITNLQPLCGRCNKEKGNQTIDYRPLRANVVRFPAEQA